LMPRSEIEMICVAEDDLGPKLLQQMLRHRLHRTDRPHGHEHRGLHLPVRQVECCAAALSMGGSDAA
ncbi:MAG: hypothetical protein JWM54_870, partial [Acidobacteriaceae bacterium]|nr:hypothetical protein [Acidobacteriaceae bacterium]